VVVVPTWIVRSKPHLLRKDIVTNPSSYEGCGILLPSVFIILWEHSLVWHVVVTPASTAPIVHYLLDIHGSYFRVGVQILHHSFEIAGWKVEHVIRGLEDVLAV